MDAYRYRGSFVHVFVKVKSNVLLSYNSDDNKILVAQAAVLISVLMSYPIMFWVAKLVVPFNLTQLRTHARTAPEVGLVFKKMRGGWGEIPKIK